MPKKSLSGPGTVYVATVFAKKKKELGRSVSYRTIERDTGLSRVTINRALSGSSAIAMDTFLRLCRALRLDPAKLVREAAARDAQAIVVPASEVIPVSVPKPQRRAPK